MSGTTEVNEWFADLDPHRLAVESSDNPYLRDLELQLRARHGRSGDRVWMPRSIDPNNEVGFGAYDYYQHGQSQGAIFPLPDGTYRITSFLTDRELGVVDNSSLAAEALEKYTKQHRVRRIMRAIFVPDTWDS